MAADGAAVVAVEHVGAGALVGPAEAREDDEVDRRLVLDDADVGVGLDALQQRALDLGAGGVGGVDDAARGVPALPREVQVAVLLIEVGAALDELADPIGSLARADLGDHLVAEARARDERVPRVGLGRVVGREDRGDAPLRVAGVGLVPVPLGEDRDRAVLGARPARR